MPQAFAHSIPKPSPMQRSQRQFRSQALQRELRPRGDIDRPLVPVTLVRTYLTGYFTAVLQPKQREPRKQPRQRMKPSFHGEVLTQDEIFLTY